MNIKNLLPKTRRQAIAYDAICWTALAAIFSLISRKVAAATLGAGLVVFLISIKKLRGRR